MSDQKIDRTLKLAKLPDRKPVRMTISLSAELAVQLREYADAYRECYGETEDAATLVPFMLATFLRDDRAVRRQKRRTRDPSESG